MPPPLLPLPGSLPTHLARSPRSEPAHLQPVLIKGGRGRGGQLPPAALPQPKATGSWTPEPKRPRWLWDRAVPRPRPQLCTQTCWWGVRGAYCALCPGTGPGQSAGAQPCYGVRLGVSQTPSHTRWLTCSSALGPGLPVSETGTTALSWVTWASGCHACLSLATALPLPLRAPSWGRGHSQAFGGPAPQPPAGSPVCPGACLPGVPRPELRPFPRPLALRRQPGPARRSILISCCIHLASNVATRSPGSRAAELIIPRARSCQLWETSHSEPPTPLSRVRSFRWHPPAGQRRRPLPAPLCLRPLPPRGQGGVPGLKACLRATCGQGLAPLVSPWQPLGQGHLP